MMKSKVLSVVPLAIIGAANAWTQGECPELAHSTPNFQMKDMTGLWFEYVWTPGFSEGFDYRCSSWTVLIAGDDEPFIFFNHQLSGKEDDEGQFFQNELAWSSADPETGFGQPTAKYVRDAPEG